MRWGQKGVEPVVDNEVEVEVKPACPKAAPLGRRETTTANLTSTLTTSASKIQQRNPYVSAIRLSTLLLCSILPSISIGSTLLVALPFTHIWFEYAHARSPFLIVARGTGCSKNSSPSPYCRPCLVAANRKIPGVAAPRAAPFTTSCGTRPNFEQTHPRTSSHEVNDYI